MAESDRTADNPLFPDPFEDLDHALIEECFEQSAVDRSSDEIDLDQVSGAGTTASTEAEVAGDDARGERIEQRGNDPVSGSAHDADFEDVIPESNPVPQEKEDFLLENLIATIDSDVAKVFGTGMLANLPEASSTNIEGLDQYVIFTLGGSEYAVHIDNVTEISEPKEVTPVPNVPSWVLGVTNLRGEIISMVDLARFLGLAVNGNSRESKRFMVVQSTHDQVRLALIVDRVNGIRYLDPDRKITTGAPIDDEVTPYLLNVCERDGRMLIVLDFDHQLLPALANRL